MQPVLPLLLLLTLHISSLPAGTEAKPCDFSCKFRFCNVGNGQLAPRGRRLQLRPPRFSAQGPVICRRKLTDGVEYILRTGEPFVRARRANDPDVPLRDWAPPGLSTPFAPRFFFAGEVPVFRKSSIARKPFKGNQMQAVQNACIRLPILRFQKVNRKTGKVVKVVNTKGRKRDCVSFIARTSSIFVELEWVGRDDLDLFVEEPDGDKVNKFNKRSEKGRLLQDVNPEKCFNKIRSGKELVVYLIDPDVEKGQYKVEVQHFQNCGDGPTPWVLRVSVDGKLVVNQSRDSDLDFSEVIVSTSFTV